MTIEPQSDLKREWDIHLVNYERNNLITCLDKIVNAIRLSALEAPLQKH